MIHENSDKVQAIASAWRLYYSFEYSCLARNKNHVKIAELLSRSKIIDRHGHSRHSIARNVRDSRAYKNITRRNEINALFAISCNEALSPPPLPRSHHRRTSDACSVCSLVELSGMRKRAEHSTAMVRPLRMMRYYTAPTDVFTLINVKRPTE